MKTNLCPLTALLALATISPAALAAAEKMPPRDAPGEMRMPGAPERRGFMRREPDKREMETVTFLGVEAGPVSPTIAAQLSLPRGTGLVVSHVVPKSPADGVLNEHDILLQLDDQILIEVRQLSVLVRNHKEGDEVSLTYMRGGQKKTVRIKLGQHEVPKFSALPGGEVRAFAFGGGMAGENFEHPIPGPGGGREEVDRVLSLIRRPPGGPGSAGGPGGPTPPPVRMQIERHGGPGFRALSINTGNSNLVFSDNEGSLELSIKEGVKTLVAKDAKGEPLFSGPVSTPEERQTLPEGVRTRLERLEGMHNLSFRTDGDFQGAETRVMRPRGIAWPLPARSSEQTKRVGPVL